MNFVLVDIVTEATYSSVTAVPLEQLLLLDLFLALHVPGRFLRKITESSDYSTRPICPRTSVKFDFTVDEGKGRLNPSRDKNQGKHRRRKVEKFCVAFLLCDPGPDLNILTWKV